MKEEMRKRIAEAVEQWDYIKRLPREWFGFQLHREMCERGDVYDIFSYGNIATRRKVTVYFHEETKEYKARVTVGLTEFCSIDYITADLDALERVLKERFARTLKDLAIFNRDTIDSVVIDKNILEWEYADRLPETIEGFRLYIKPKEPLRILNGSYIIFDYCDFEEESNFIIYYNIFRDEFFGEAKIRRLPEMNYMFDCHDLLDLEEKLDAYLVDRLKELRARLNEGTGV